MVTYHGCDVFRTQRENIDVGRSSGRTLGFGIWIEVVGDQTGDKDCKTVEFYNIHTLICHT